MASPTGREPVTHSLGNSCLRVYECDLQVPTLSNPVSHSHLIFHRRSGHRVMRLLQAAAITQSMSPKANVAIPASGVLAAAIGMMDQAAPGQPPARTRRS